MTKLDEAIAYVEDELEYANNPGSYMDSTWYDRCRYRADALDDVLDKLKQLKNEEE